GQLAGLTRMVEEHRDVLEILQQSAAIHGALRAVDRQLIATHLAADWEQVSSTHQTDPRVWEDIVADIVKHLP
ncbi:MAG: metal-sensing transcriptional repressor, partial [Anaerolineae bacterium]|nr:metal-sensing transcriptional repressor [Anaerolineae bacterium]